MKSEPGPPMTLGGAAAAQLRFIVWCKDYQHQVEPDPGEMAERYGAANSGARLARTAGLLEMRQPRNRYGFDRNKAVWSPPSQLTGAPPNDR
jgi:hypothetical protein